jgi:hypothetical protein
MSDERLLIDSDYFEGLAFGVFENASNVDSGRSALLEAYNAYTWTDPKKAKQILEYYGQALKFRDQDQSTFGEDVEKLAPVKMSDVTSMPGIETVQDAYTKWEELNNDYLNSKSLEPTYVVAKQQFLNDIKTHASAKRREANTEDSGVGENIRDTGARFLRGVTAGIEPIINSAVNIFTDGYELNDHLTELTNPERDGKFIHELAGAAGNVAGFVGAGALAKGAGVLGFSLTQAGDQVVDRYQDTMRLTGDPGKASKATAYEAASQTLQTVGEKLVFGRMASTMLGKPTGTIGNDVVRAAGIEGFSEGAGQAISNIAENVQKAQPELEDVWRGVGLNMALGAVAGGAATAGAHYFPSKNNSDTRAEEIRETGEPVTPVTKQVVGDIPQNVDTFVNDDVANLSAPAIVEENVTPAFESDDGTTYVETQPGKFIETGTLPFDYTFFLSEEDAKKVATAITSGENVVNTDQGVAIQHMDTEGNLTVEVLEPSRTPSVGAFPLNISNPRSPNSDTKVLPIKLGRRIREVSSSQSVGAAGPAKNLKEVESEYSRKIRTSSSVGFMRKVGDEGLFYRPQKSSDVDTEVVIPIVLRNGVDKLVEIMSKPDTAPELKARMRVQLHNMYTTAGLKAAAEGDTKLAAAIEAEYRSRAQLISDIGTSGGRTLAFNKGKIDIDVLTKPVRAGDLAYKDALITAGKEEGVDPLEIANSPENIEQLTSDIEKIERKISQAEVAGTPEEKAIYTVVADIENAAREKLIDDLTILENEKAILEQEVATIKKKAERSKRKAISKVEQAVASDSETLINVIESAKDIKNITAEESAKIGKEVDSLIKTAESKANSEVIAAAKEERATRETIRRSTYDVAVDKVTKAEAALDTLQQKMDVKLSKLYELESKAIEKNADPSAIRAKIDAEIDKLTRAENAAQQRIADAQENLRKVEEQLALDALENIETEDMLDELESGIEVQITPVKGGRRSIQIKTKKSGLNVNKLFSKKSQAFGSLSALAKGVNDLSNIFSQGKDAKDTTNAQIKELQDRIKANKELLAKSREADPLTAAERKKVDAATKRLEELLKEKIGATPESRIPRGKLETYKKYKNKLDEIKKGPKVESEESKAAKKELARLEAARRKAERLLEKKRLAEQKQAEAVRNESANQLRIIELEKMLEDTNLSNTERATVEAELLARKGTDEKDPVKRSDFARMWTSNLIGAPVGIAIGNLSGALEPVVATFGMSPDALRIFYKNVRAGELKYKTPLMEYYKGLFNSTAWKRGYKAAMIALTTGERVRATLTPKEVAAGRELLNASATIEYSQVIGDWVKATKDMKFDGSIGDNLLTAVFKASGIMSGTFLRVMTALEAQMSAVHDSSYDRASAAYYYNKAVDEGVSDAELAEYMYSPKKNWARAQAETAYKAKQLKSAGIPMTPKQQHLSSIERYLTYRPKQVEISAWKKANSVGLNAPAPGYIGYISHAIETNLKSMEGIPGLNKLKYLVPFTNSIAQLMGRAVDMTPFAFVGATMGKDFTNRTDFERMTMIGASITSTTAMAALAIAGLKQLEVPEDERLFDIVGNYSSDKKKRDVFTGNGGLLYSVKIGNVYIPFGETPFVLMLGGVASVLDRVRDGKEPSPETATEMMYAGSVMLMNNIKGLGSLSMLRGVSELMGAFSDAAKGEPDADIRVARTLLNTFKGFIPGATIWRTISRYTDNPVDAKKDIMSAIVEGIPGLQSMGGEPALNIFGEPMKKRHEEVYSMHRLFSTRGGDVDMRWLSDNGYTTPILSNLRFSDKIQAYAAKGDEAGAKALDYQFKRKVYQAASPELRDLVGRYRQAYSYSAYSDRVQEQLNTDWNKILAKHAAKIVTE